MSSKILKSQLAHVDFLVSAAGTEVIKINWLMYNCIQFNVYLKSKTKAESLKKCVPLTNWVTWRTNSTCRCVSIPLRVCQANPFCLSNKRVSSITGVPDSITGRHTVRYIHVTIGWSIRCWTTCWRFRWWLCDQMSDNTQRIYIGLDIYLYGSGCGIDLISIGLTTYKQYIPS